MRSRPDKHRPYELVWSFRWPGVSLHYQEEPYIGVRLMLVAGWDREEAVEHVRRLLPIVSLEALVLEAYSAVTSEEKIRIVRRVAAATGPDLHQGALLVFQACFIDADPTVRSAAVFATSYPGWREFEEPLAVLAEHDPALEVRDLAARTVDALRRHNW